VRVVGAESSNMKITTREDLRIAELLLAQRAR
jgi:2-C-methyl-D-erythritol 4-phosphate cytidylyltransferase